MSKPVAVVISDIHYNINTLDVADNALFQAVTKANELEVRLIITGDLHDTKANLRAECVGAIIRTLESCEVRPFVLRGNHDSLNEKSDHSALEFLNRVACVIEYPEKHGNWYFMPYQHEPSNFKSYLDDIPRGSTVFCHQGVINANAGHYIQDKSAVPKEWLAWNRVISGHYHNRQTIECGQSHGAYLGQFDYVGNPYTLNFAEANDPEKGFQVLYDDGHLEFIPTNLRKHLVYESCISDIQGLDRLDIKDILWVKITGPSDSLSTFSKADIAESCRIKQDFRLDLIPNETKSIGKTDNETISQSEVLDTLIEGLTNTDNQRKLRLKGLWKKLI